MSTDVSYPGVYVAEADGVNLSVYPVATAVPIFALNNTSDNNKGLFNVATKVYSWADWLNKKGDKDTFTYVEDGVLKLYFANGGGPCYVVSVTTLAAQVPLYADRKRGTGHLDACRHVVPGREQSFRYSRRTRHRNNFNL